MAFDETLAERVRHALSGTSFTEKKMFGGLAFLSRGYMFIGVNAASLMARVGPGRYAAALRRAHVREMDFTGRPLTGYVFVDPPGYAGDADLRRWVRECLAFVDTLPDKA